MGSNIVEEVVRDLVEVHRMGEVQSNDSLNSESTLVYLAGSRQVINSDEPIFKIFFLNYCF